MSMKRLATLTVALAFILCSALSVSAEESAPVFGLDLGIGAETVGGETYQTLNFTPDFAIGKFGVGLDVTIHYTFTGALPNDQQGFKLLLDGDWIPTADKNFLELYLPKVRYVRFGTKGEPLFVKYGMIDDGSLGNGYILSGYDNTLFTPDYRVAGLSLDVDGAAFGLPVIGLETFVGNLSAFDLFGGRFFVRPLSLLEIPILKDLQVGLTLVADNNVYYWEKKFDDTITVPTVNSTLVMGGDFRLPVLGTPILSLATFGDIVLQGNNMGGMLGGGGKLLGIFTYAAQLRFSGANFIPAYFDSGYDLYRTQKLAIASSETELIQGNVGWFASLGTSFLDGGIVFNANLAGPFGLVADDVAAYDEINYPTLRGVFNVAEGMVPGFSGLSMNASYVKKGIKDFSQLIDPTNAIIGAKINFATGPAILSLVYTAKWNPSAAAGEEWEVTSGIESSISLF